MESKLKPEVRQTLTDDWEKVGIRKPRSIFKSCSISAYDASLIGFRPDQYQFERPMQYFNTGSSYEGVWDALGFSGIGTYIFPHGAIYQGFFRDGQFHGKGIITYPNGHKLKGLWKRGKLIERKFKFPDGLAVSSRWKYCKIPDRRFQSEFNTSLKGPGEEYLTNRQPTIDIPKGCFDTTDGYYEPNVKCIFNYDEEAIATGMEPTNRQQSESLKRTVLPEEGKLIEENYRASRLDNIGYRPDLYEYWATGKSQELKLILKEISCENLSVAEASGTTLGSLASTVQSDIEVINY